jgi:Holliday junction DNA helicase RuvB
VNYPFHKPKPNFFAMTETTKPDPFQKFKPDDPLENVLQPHHLWEMIGQDKIRQNLAALILAANNNKELIDHLLFSGSPGLGKTTFARSIANDMGVKIKVTSGDAIERAGDLAAIITNIRSGDIFLIQRIETLRKPVVDILSIAMKDYALDIIIGKKESARSIRLKIPRFTVIGTTSKLLQVDERLKDLMFEFDFAPYTDDEIEKIIIWLAEQQKMNIKLDAVNLLAKYCNGSPAQAFSLLRRLYKNALFCSNGIINLENSKEVLSVINYKNNPVSKDRQPIPEDVKLLVWQRDGGRCVKCGSQEKLEYDHIIPLAKGGSNTTRNIQLLCENCNRSKGANLY